MKGKTFLKTLTIACLFVLALGCFMLQGCKKSSSTSSSSQQSTTVQVTPTPSSDANVNTSAEDQCFGDDKPVTNPK